ncbi:Putative carbohydrate-binding WSC, PAN/Apple domain, alpha/Beta hydrolase [Septoria linicola]|uniref:Carbohydrate-binding WSC, PAN/Apple domain, alpha/Beta hydrolase n=1 Tax=Septoria linicola TaxID=215465 RepID=A0A9Q9AKQ3_9PEZI|nr:Putative carbohydrate-binding WSC, PAN/Apple domain, alpha/Beta hydrolase [Septoria linicola]
MRPSLASWALAASLSLSPLSNAQQYAGDVITTNLPDVPGAEVTFFKIADVTKQNNNLTLINYYSHGIGNKRLVESKVQRAVIMIHGLNRDPGTYMSNMLSALAQVNSDPNINFDSVAILAPYFPNGDDKRTGYPWTDGLAAGKGSTTNCLVWPGSQWSAGGNNQYPSSSKGTSSYTVLDQLVQYFDNRALFPNMKQIVVAGHSLGAQTVQRYAAIGNQLNTQSPVSYWIGNPNSYAWLSTDRPFSTASCPTYDDYREGYNKFTTYPMTYATGLVSQGRAAIQANFNSKAINYARGTQDLGDSSSSCAPGTTGSNRNERFFNFIKAFPPSCSDPTGRNCDTVDFVNMGHDGGGMMASIAGQARLFIDNFYGNGNRSYDFGYPRQQAGDDPFPNPSLNTTASSINNNTYAGNMTYGGCWSDQNPQTLTNKVYENDANTIELCTQTCADAGNTIAGLENGNQCFCGKALGYMATQVIESSCSAPCSGNSTQNCGGSNRLSIFSAGRPALLEAPSTPETIGNYYYASCYTEATSGRALTGKGTSSPSMTLEYCASFCSGYAYFGTEYGAECYCGNSFSAGAVRTLDSDCNMLCANATNQFCGAGNRLTVYNNPDIVVSSSTSSTSSSVTATPTAGSSSISCPSADGTTVTSIGKKFLIECGIDHAGGDIASTTVSSFQGCVDACAQNSQCVDVSLSGSACYLKGTLGAAVSNAAIWGAKLVTSQSSSSSTSSSVSTSSISSTSSSSVVVSASTTMTSSSASISSSSSSSSTSSSATASASATVLSCPASNSTTYTSNNRSYMIECGIDHAGGDMKAVNANSLNQCADACATTDGCLAASFLGAACYLKSSVGASVFNAVQGLRRIENVPSSTSTISSSTSTSSLSTSSVSSSTSSVTTFVTSTSLPVSSQTSSDSTSSSVSTAATSSDSSSVPTASPTGTIASSSASTTVPVASALPSGYSALGCFVDSGAARVLPTLDSSSNTQTVQTCAMACSNKGFKYSGVEYAQECWCGNSAPKSSASASSADCDMKCKGDSTQICGGSNRISVTIDTAWKQTFFARETYNSWSLQGCYIDGSTRTLPQAVSLSAYGGSSNATISNCLDACNKSGFAYCGEEYYSECWASNVAPTAALADGDDPLTAGCNYPCNGNKTEACGGANRILVYLNGAKQ